jgi:hypothetical protein
VDAAEDLEQGGLAGAIAPNDADDFSLLDFKVHVPKRPEFFGGGRSEIGSRRWEMGDGRLGTAIVIGSVRACDLSQPAPRC